MLTKRREIFKPFVYPKAYDYWLKQQNAHWLHTEIPMASDIQDWEVNLTKSEKNVIASILKGFIQTEIVVNDYWTQKVSKWFPHPEIAMMGSCFGSMECFDDQTELLTKDGWKNVKDLTIKDIYAQYDIETGEISFTKANKVVSYDYKGPMHHYISKTTDICVTPNHDLILVNPHTKKFKKKKSNEGKWGRNFLYPVSGKGCGPQIEVTDLERLYIAIQGDGCLKGLCEKSKDTWRTCDFNLTNQRKKNKLETLFQNLNLKFSKKDCENSTKYTINIPGDVEISKIKSFDFIDLQNFSSEKAFDFIQELIKWNGSVKNNGANYYWYSSNLAAVNKIHALGVLANIRCTKGINRSKEKSANIILPQGTKPKIAKDCFVISFSKNNLKTYPHREEVQYNGKVYCVSVPTQNLVSRRNDKVAITGNTIHTIAYAYLNDSLGLLDYDAFLKEPAAKAKLDRLRGVEEETLNDIARSLAIFSGFTEGVSLFSSFAVLLSFSRFNKLKGVGQIISFSIRDESLHSEAGCWLFRQLISEHPDLWTDDLKKTIYDAARLTVSLEDDFIDSVFSVGEIDSLNSKDLKNFIRNRANVKLGDLGLKTNWKNVDKESLKNMEWFDFLSTGVEQQDFFANRVSDYSKGVVNFDDIF